MSQGQTQFVPRTFPGSSQEQPDQTIYVYVLSGFKKALLQNPREMIRGRIFREMIRVSARKSELQPRKSDLQAKSRSYNGADPQNPNRISQEGNPNRVWVLLQKTPLKAFLNPVYVYVPCSCLIIISTTPFWDTPRQLSSQGSKTLAFGKRRTSHEAQSWEVLNGVGVDGVGVIFPLFYAYFVF